MHDRRRGSMHNVSMWLCTRKGCGCDVAHLRCVDALALPAAFVRAGFM